MHKKRRVIEIYFVLYLAALILLIPGRDSDDFEKLDDNSNVFNLPYSIKPEKSTLICRMALDSNGLNILSIDSINTIFFTGNAKSVSYEFLVESKPLGQRIILATNDNKQTKLFKIVENEKSQTASFIWEPPKNLRSSTTYLVNVIAEITPENSELAPIEVKTQFSLIVYFYEQQYAINSINDNDLALADSQYFASIQRYNTPVPSGNIILEPSKNKVRSIAYENWENTIFILGLNPLNDLKKNPELSIDLSHSNNGGTAKILNIYHNSIKIGGVTPGFGSMKVSLNVVRSYDSQEAEVNFNVVPQAIEKPLFSEIMYPEREYTIKPNLPLTSTETRAILKKDNKSVAISKQGEDFTYTPLRSDIGKVLRLELYVDGNIYGQIYEISVEDYPKPVIVNIIKESNNKVKIQTRAHGTYKGERNYIKKLEIQGNAEAFELRGDAYYNSDENYYIQFFEVKPDNPSNRFQFSVEALDLRNYHSEKVSYP